MNVVFVIANEFVARLGDRSRCRRAFVETIGSLTVRRTATAATGTAAASSGSATAAAPNPATVTHGPGETLLTGTNAAKAKAAALAAVPGGTIIRVETDSGGATYEAHVKKADGSYVTVKLDSDFTVTATQSGFGTGGPAGAARQAPDLAIAVGMDAVPTAAVRRRDVRALLGDPHGPPRPLQFGEDVDGERAAMVLAADPRLGESPKSFPPTTHAR